MYLYVYIWFSLKLFNLSYFLNQIICISYCLNTPTVTSHLWYTHSFSSLDFSNNIYVYKTDCVYSI